jgi:diacylglycerol O-acyltransferase / trehalose O-mycolyltransferase / mycolyltransferase Ag85
VAAALLAAGCGSDERAADRAPGGATVRSERRVAPRILDLTIRSPALGADAKVRLITPVGWTRERRWPVLYLVHGCCDTYDSWTRETDVEALPQLRDVLVVTPEAGDVGFYSDWLRGPAWETFHVEELRALLERDYGAGTRRAVAGLSMGGLGAMGYAARHPDLFGAAASFSGTLHPLASPRGYLGLFGQYADDPLAVWGDPRAQRDVWKAHDPTELAADLRGTRLFVSAGDGRPGPFEEPGARRDPLERAVGGESRAFVARLRRRGIPVQTDFYGPGTHDWPYWERELTRALPLLRRELGR